MKGNSGRGAAASDDVSVTRHVENEEKAERAATWQLFFLPVPVADGATQAVRVAAFCPFSKVLAYGTGKDFAGAMASAIDCWVDEAASAVLCVGGDRCSGCGSCAREALADAKRLLKNSRVVFGTRKVLQQVRGQASEDLFVIAEYDDAPGCEAVLVRPRTGLVSVLSEDIDSVQEERVLDSELTERFAEHSSIGFPSTMPRLSPSDLSLTPAPLPAFLMDTRVWCTAAVSSLT